MNPISKKLIAWYASNKRDLPWRNTGDAYQIWLSEIILQQTQVAQGMSYYLKFIEHYPTVDRLALAPEDEVMRLWQGLGYYSRARNLHAAAKHIHAAHDSRFPETYAAIRQLKGVGDYTAAAIASFAYNLPHAVVDGNVYRVLSRLFAVDTPIDSTAGKKEFQVIADELLDRKRPGLHNNAMMEFGALHCRPQNPLCETCPVQVHCLAYAQDRVEELPVKGKKTKVRERYFNYLVLRQGSNVYIRKRSAKDIWQNLYEFFLIESGHRLSEEALLGRPELQVLKKKFSVKLVSKEYRHVLSHQVLHARFYVLELGKSQVPEGFTAVSVNALNNYALPRLADKFLEEHPLT